MGAPIYTVDGQLIEHFTNEMAENGTVEGFIGENANDEESGYYQVYTPFTEEEIIRRAAMKRIAELKKMLAETDYAIVKIAEGAAMKDEYREVITNRQAWRKEINDLGG